MTLDITLHPPVADEAPAPTAGGPPADIPKTGDPDPTEEGWQALAVASLGRPLTPAELAHVEQLPAEQALDLYFPHLDDPARHEALCALG